MFWWRILAGGSVELECEVVGEFAAAGDTEFDEDCFEMVLHGVGGDLQPGGDLPGAPPGRRPGRGPRHTPPTGPARPARAPAPVPSPPVSRGTRAHSSRVPSSGYDPAAR